MIMPSFDVAANPLRRALESLSREWIARGLPSRQMVFEKARSLDHLRQQNSWPSLWPAPPSMLTATLDDGIGQGLELIHVFAELMGVEVIALGLLQTPVRIVAECRRRQPDYLGLTVLQLDSEEPLARVAAGLPRRTRLIAGGALFRLDPEAAARCRLHAYAAHVGNFIDILLRDSIASAP